MYLMVHITDLRSQDEILCWTKIGLALKKGRKVDGELFRFVPLKPCVAGADDLSRFVAKVLDNDLDFRYLTLSVSRTGKMGDPRSDSLKAVVAYPVFQRIRLISKLAYPAKEENIYRPTSHALGTAFRPYHTAVDVSLV